MNFSEILNWPIGEASSAVQGAVASGEFMYRVPGDHEQAGIRQKVSDYLENGISGSVSDVRAAAARRQVWERCYAESAVVPPFLVKFSF